MAAQASFFQQSGLIYFCEEQLYRINFQGLILWNLQHSVVGFVVFVVVCFSVCVVLGFFVWLFDLFGLFCLGGYFIYLFCFVLCVCVFCRQFHFSSQDN